MKKFRVLMAAGVFALAFGAAFATQKASEASTMAYIQVGNECQLQQITEDCDLEHTTLCTILGGTVQVYEKPDDSNPSVCVNFLTRP